MRKLKTLSLLLVAVFVLGACGNSKKDQKASNNSEASTADKAKKADGTDEKLKSNSYSVGDTAEVGEIKYTVNSVETTEKRNEDEEEQPADVIKVEYTIENNSDEEVPVGGDITAYDKEGTQLKQYPNGNTMDDIEKGKSMDAVVYFGIDELGEVQLQVLNLNYFDSDPLVYKATVE